MYNKHKTVLKIKSIYFYFCCVNVGYLYFNERSVFIIVEQIHAFTIVLMMDLSKICTILQINELDVYILPTNQNDLINVDGKAQL